jgi:hypothetical protein
LESRNDIIFLRKEKNNFSKEEIIILSNLFSQNRRIIFSQSRENNRNPIGIINTFSTIKEYKSFS